MMRGATLGFVLGFVLAALVGVPAPAKDLDAGGWMIRVLACEGEDAKMEVYLPQSIVLGKVPIARALASPVNSYYTLDLTNANKGKSLEPVKVSMAASGKTVIVDQVTRGLPPTRIPVGGGTVDFDQRFGTQAKCGPFQWQDPNYGQQK
ncbi:MAG TPA: hypothetical protein VMA30_07065 [Xanthobacteraceae bacterium]|nr:hypothetical protein [Xanthobacteraceae bacterium]